MANIKKNIKCSACSTEFPLLVETDLLVSDLSMSTTCAKCGSTMQLHFGTFDGAARQAQPAPAPQPRLDDSIFVQSDIPSSEIKKLIEE
jgi:hypothetical protein